VCVGIELDRREAVASGAGTYSLAFGTTMVHPIPTSLPPLAAHHLAAMAPLVSNGGIYGVADLKQHRADLMFFAVQCMALGGDVYCTSHLLRAYAVCLGHGTATRRFPQLVHVPQNSWTCPFPPPSFRSR